MLKKIDVQGGVVTIDAMGIQKAIAQAISMWQGRLCAGPEGQERVAASICHAAGEFARDEDGDGFCEVHVNTIEGFWSLLRSWLHPRRGISQGMLPFYLSCFELVHNVRKRGKTLLGGLISVMVKKLPGIPDEPFSFSA